MKPTIEDLDPLSLEIHPVLDGYPDLSQSQYQALKASIAELGIKTELRGVPTREGGVAIYSGRHRRRAAIELHLGKVPVLVNGVDPAKLAEFVLDEVLTGRQLTPSGIVLMLFERHPAIAHGAGQRKGGAGSHRKSQLSSEKTVEAEGASYRQLAERYQVPKDYFGMLAAIQRACRPEADDWALVRQAIIEEQIAIPRIQAGQGGRAATKGGKKTPPVYLQLAANGKLTGIMPEAITGLGNGFRQWAKLDLAARGQLKSQWEELLEILPEDLQ